MGIVCNFKDYLMFVPIRTYFLHNQLFFTGSQKWTSVLNQGDKERFYSSLTTTLNILKLKTRPLFGICFIQPHHLYYSFKKFHLDKILMILEENVNED